MISIPKVTKEEAKKFSNVWNFKGIAIIVDDVHCEFASNFANVVLKSFVENLMRQQAAEAEKAKIVVAAS